MQAAVNHILELTSLRLQFYDWFDTFFFVLRKKENQISVLHVYHHAGMPLTVWMGN